MPASNTFADVHYDSNILQNYFFSKMGITESERNIKENISTQPTHTNICELK